MRNFNAVLDAMEKIEPRLKKAWEKLRRDSAWTAPEQLWSIYGADATRILQDTAPWPDHPKAFELRRAWNGSFP